MSNQEEISKPRLFIGSSKESKSLMREMQTILSQYCDVKPWDRDIFHIGRTILEELRREVLLSDFALLVLFPDDKIVKRNKRGYSARDNVLFELGLFMGVLGRKRSFWLSVTDKRRDKNKKVLIPTDLLGQTKLDIALVSNSKFQPNPQTICNEIKKAIEREEHKLAFTMLPSTALAIGYFNNFVKQVCDKLLETDEYHLDGKTYDFTRGNFRLYIVLPDSPVNAGISGYRQFLQNRGLKPIAIDAPGRSFAFYIDSIRRDGHIALYDFPTTIRSSWDAIEHITQETDISLEERNIMERREIVNFERTIYHLLKKGGTVHFRDKVQIIYLNRLEKQVS